MKRSYFIIISFILIACFKTNGQVKLIDSLKNLLTSNTIKGQERVDLINEIAFEYFDLDDSLGLQFAKEGLSEASKINYKRGIKYGHLLVGIGYYSHAAHKEAKYNLLKSISIDLKDNDKDGYNLYAISLLANVYRTVAQYDSAWHYYKLARRNLNAGNRNRWSTLYKNIALLKLRLWENEAAIKYLDSARAAINIKNASTVSFDIYISYVNAYQNLGKEDSAKVYLDLSCNNPNTDQDNFSLIKCLLNQSRSAYRMGDYPSALNYAIKALNHLDQYSYPPQQAEVLTRIGEIYTELSDYTLASKYLFQALAISDKFGFDYEKAYVLCEIGWIYKDQNNFKLALDYVNRSQKIRESIGDKFGLGICHNTRGLIFLLQKKYKESIDEHQKAMKLREEISHREGIAASLFNISLALVELGRDDEALKYMLKSIKVEEGFTNKQSLAISYDYLASYLIKKGRLNEAEEYLVKCRALASQTKSKLLQRNNAGYFSDYYEAKGDYRKALEYRKLYEQLNDSIYSQSGAAKLAEMEALYQLDKMEQQIVFLDKENALKESNLQFQNAQIRQQRLIIIASLIVVLLISGIAFVVYRYYRRVKLLNREIYERTEEIQVQSEELTEANTALTKLNFELSEKREEIQAQSEELQEANEKISEVNKYLEQRVEERTSELRQAYKELDTFFYRSSHDFRRPLTTFMGLAEVARVTLKDERALELFSKVNETAHYLDKMLFKLQSISDLGAQEIVFKEVFIKDIFDNVCDIYRNDLQENRIKTTCIVNLKDPFLSYPALLKIIFENLIENSIFFYRKEEPAPFILLTVNEINNKVIFQFEDNGQGISEEFHDRIFEMYFRGSERSKGNGLGLYIVKKAIEKLGGKISLESSVEKGAKFVLEFIKT